MRADTERTRRWRAANPERYRAWEKSRVRDRTREYERNRQRAAARRGVRVQPACEHCAGPVLTNTIARWCSPACRTYAWRKRNPDRAKAIAARAKAAEKAARRAAKAARRGVRVQPAKRVKTAEENHTHYLRYRDRILEKLRSDPRIGLAGETWRLSQMPLPIGSVAVALRDARRIIHSARLGVAKGNDE